ncbi:MAG: ParB family protein [Shinella sp.]|nr:ParB family protein [Shinella sp.]
MDDPSPQDIATKLRSENFGQSAPLTEALSDPIADTPMVVTLDDLRPYELDPRITRNPLFDDIKASIRERGLDAPPPITRRPGADHYIIRNGGNTRLSILRELWTETRDARFFRISCLFRPWPERGDIVALTGHLAENELHGGLSFIERALGVEKARELYEQDGKPLSQSELARRLKADGYPVPQPHISRMQEAIQYLLPAIPNVLYSGLGRPQVEQLTSLRRAATRVWEAKTSRVRAGMDFAIIFQDVLASFDGSASSFSVQRVQDELIGQMADLLGEKYHTLEFEITDSDKRWQTLSREADPNQHIAETGHPVVPLPALQLSPSLPANQPPLANGPAIEPEGSRLTTSLAIEEGRDEDGGQMSPRIEDSSPSLASDRLESIQRLVANQLGETPSEFDNNDLLTIPAHADGLYPVSDIWFIEPGLDAQERLRAHIAQLAREIADEADLAGQVVPCGGGIGFSCAGDAGRSDDRSKAQFARSVLALLHVLSAPYHPLPRSAGRVETLHLASDIGLLLLGPGEAQGMDTHQPVRLSDDGLVKLLRLVRLARRLLELEATSGDGDAMARS